MGVLSIRKYEYSRLSREKTSPRKAQTAAKNGSAVSQRVFPSCACGFSPSVWFGLSFLVLDDAICVVGECEFLQRTVPSQHGAVSGDVTLSGRDVILFFS